MNVRLKLFEIFTKLRRTIKFFFSFLETPCTFGFRRVVEQLILIAKDTVFRYCNWLISRNGYVTWLARLPVLTVHIVFLVVTRREEFSENKLRTLQTVKSNITEERKMWLHIWNKTWHYVISYLLPVGFTYLKIC